MQSSPTLTQAAKNAAELHVSCPLCGDRILRARWEINGYPIVSCDSCSLVFVQTKVTAEELTKHYEGVVDQAYDDTNQQCLAYYYKNLGKLIQKYHPEPGRLLDVGCSGGWFFDVMKGWECYGNEIVASDAEAARQRYGDHVFHGSFDHYPVRAEYFDVITLQDVFDHMPDPIAALGKCYSLLKPAGILVIKVHNISCLYAKLSGSKFYALLPPSHLFYYNRETLRLVLGKTGFQMAESRFMAHLLTFRTVIVRLARNDISSWWYRLFRPMTGSWLGDLKIRKNLHDVITVVAFRNH